VNEFMPHGMCYLWEPGLLWLHVISDVLTGLAYFAIPPMLVLLVLRARRIDPGGPEQVSRGLPHEWILLAFGLFIVACGSTHFFAAWNVWNADYWTAGGVKAITAVASVGTAVALPPLIPRILEVIRDARESSARRERLEAANAELRQVRDQLQADLKSATGDVRELTLEVQRRQREMERALEDAEAARDEAAAANQAKTDFLAVMSHELRTPLNAIAGYTDLLAQEVVGPVTDAQRTQLERVRVGVKHLTGVIDDILVFARRRPESRAIEPEPLQLRPWALELSAMVRTDAERKGLALLLDVEDDRVEVDRELLTRIVRNLLTNAVKFTDSGRVRLRIRADHALRVEVEDTGRGITAADQERIFDPFWQVERSLTRTAGGTGLGLSIARQSAETLGGELEVTSEVGRGSTFTLTVPLDRPAVA
jgi:signal transduction histidine kinase